LILKLLWLIGCDPFLALLQAQGIEWITTNQPQQFQNQLKDIKKQK
jgi:hypothetical protein